MVTNNIAIILARAGSKRLPKKNILNLGGKPLIAWSIEAAVRSKVFTKILVSTDCKLIADISIKYGAEVPFLRNENSDDFSKSSLATYTALNQAEKYWKIKFDVVTQLMANCPLRTERDIRKSTNVFIKKNIPAQISCSKFGWMNPFWAFKLDKKKRAKFLFPNKKNNRSQDLDPLFCPTGALWIAKRDLFCKVKNFYMKGCEYEAINWMSAIDIDNKNDFDMAKILLDYRIRKNIHKN
jgi:CMP-N-acetylneuraminic acid synthetase